MLTYEEKARNNGYSRVCGVDEAGAGPLAGPVVAAAVILPTSKEALQPLFELGLTDSKKLSDKKREQLFPVVKEVADAYFIAEVSHEEIDKIDILNARIKAMALAVEGLTVPADFALIDGNRDKGSQVALTMPRELIVKGDSLSLSIAAASILAKVSRDLRMIAYDEEYPQYEFARHKGYGTVKHYECIRAYKLCPIHRVTFLKKKWSLLGLDQ